MNLYSLVCIKPDFVPDFIIQDLLNLKDQKTEEATVLDGGNIEVKEYRSTQWITLDEQLIENLMSTVYGVHQQEFSNLYKTSVKNIEPTQFLKYGVGGRYDDHNDSEDWDSNNQLKRVINRDITVLFYLNDDYEGGELEFTRLGLTIKPKRGMMVAFPSYIEFSHRVHPITSGTRYNLVTWIETEQRIIPRPYDDTKYTPRSAE